jgi:hypothetical protein
VIDVAAIIAAVGLDPMRYLESEDPLERAVMQEVAERAFILRQNSMQNATAKALGG